jgi:hypothetical protein
METSLSNTNGDARVPQSTNLVPSLKTHIFILISRAKDCVYSALVALVYPESISIAIIRYGLYQEFQCYDVQYQKFTNVRFVPDFHIH